MVINRNVFNKGLYIYIYIYIINSEKKINILLLCILHIYICLIKVYAIYYIYNVYYMYKVGLSHVIQKMIIIKLHTIQLYVLVYLLEIEMLLYYM